MPPSSPASREAEDIIGGGEGGTGLSRAAVAYFNLRYRIGVSDVKLHDGSRREWLPAPGAQRETGL